VAAWRKPGRDADGPIDPSAPTVDLLDDGTWSPDLDETPVPAASVPPPAETHRYEVGSLLGRGGLADVHAARDERLGREVALKRLRHLGGTSRRRFLREARVTAQLEHPHIVPVHDAGMEPDGTPFYTMKYVRGTSMSEALAGCESLEERLAMLPSFLTVCQAMAYAHQRRVIHRDLKPDNLMLGEFGEALVVDWGLARALDEPDETLDDATDAAPRPLDIDHGALTVVGSVSGTPAYMAPEQARGEPTGPSTDVYALGAILYELLTGSPPHGRDADLDTQLERARAGRIRPVAAVVDDAPGELAAIAERALQPDAAARYPSAAELLADLRAFTSGRMVGAYRYSTREQVARLVRRYRLPLGVAAAALAAATVVGAVGIVNVRNERDLARLWAQSAQNSQHLAMERSAELSRQLALYLAENAQRALHDDDAVMAASLAVASLQQHATPEAWGTLAGAWALPHATPVGQLESPVPCKVVAWVGDDVACLGDERLVRLSLDGTVRWERAADSTHAFDVDAEGRTMATTDGDDIVVFDAASGTETLRLRAPGTRSITFGDDGTLLWIADRTVGWRSPDGTLGHRDTSGAVSRVVWRDGAPWMVAVSGWVRGLQARDKLAHVDLVTLAAAATDDGFLMAGDHVQYVHADGTPGASYSLPGASAHGLRTFGEIGSLATAEEHAVLFHAPSGTILHHLPPVPDAGMVNVDLGPKGWLVVRGTSIHHFALPSNAEFALLLDPEPVGRVLRHDHSEDVARLYRDGRVDRVDAHGEVVDRWAIDDNGGVTIYFSGTHPTAVTTQRRYDLLPGGEVRSEVHGLGPVVVFGGHTLARAQLSGGQEWMSWRDPYAYASTAQTLSWWRREGETWVQQGERSANKPLSVDEEGDLWRREPSGTLFVEDPISGTPKHTLIGHDALPTQVERLSEDHAATGGWDHQILVWDLPSEQVIARLQGHTGRIAHMAFQPGIGHLHSTAFGDRARIWDLSVMEQSPDDLAAQLADRYGVTIEASQVVPVR
jgi:hypothetical protein